LPLKFALELSRRPLESQLASAIIHAYQALGDNLSVAVRSSATAEDLASASFAGKQDTFLDIFGDDAVLDAVRRCWASLWTDRAVIYRATASIDQREVRLAVVVQKMVHAVAAGVLFTANPLTGRRRQSVSDNITTAMPRDLKGLMEWVTAAMGLFLNLNNPTREMTTEVA